MDRGSYKTNRGATENYRYLYYSCNLPASKDKYPPDFPYGPDLDNLMKRFCDALNTIIFSNTRGKDSCIIEMSVMKTKVNSETEAGALLEVLPISIKEH